MESEPTATRRDALRKAWEHNRGMQRPPCRGIRFESRRELEWAIAENGWVHAPANRVDLREAKLPGLDLAGIDLRYALLTDADLLRVNLTGAHLDSAELQRATLTGVSAQRCRMAAADLADAKAQSINLAGAHLAEANLRGTDLTHARMDRDTDLNDAQLDQRTKLGRIIWNDVSLTGIDWSEVKRIGDEQEIEAATSDVARTRAYREVACAYRDLALQARAQGISDAASMYRLREQAVLRRSMRANGRYGKAVFSWLLNVISGYGERPGRAVLTYLFVIGLWTGLFLLVTHAFKSGVAHLTPFEALILSLSSFHGRGFVPSAIMGTLNDPVAMVAAFESVVGLFVEVIVIATFSRRFLGE